MASTSADDKTMTPQRVAVLRAARNESDERSGVIGSSSSFLYWQADACGSSEPMPLVKWLGAEMKEGVEINASAWLGAEDSFDLCQHRFNMMGTTVGMSDGPAVVLGSLTTLAQYRVRFAQSGSDPDQLSNRVFVNFIEGLDQFLRDTMCSGWLAGQQIECRGVNCWR